MLIRVVCDPIVMVVMVKGTVHLRMQAHCIIPTQARELYFPYSTKQDEMHWKNLGAESLW